MSRVWFIIVTMGLLVSPEAVFGIRFEIEKQLEECFSQNVEFLGDSIHLSFVVVSVHTSWRHQPHKGIDLLVKGPLGEKIEELRGKTSEKLKFVADRRGAYRFCFTNKSPHKETIDFDIHITRHHEFYDDEQHVQNEHFSPLLEQIQKLGEALELIEFEQQWLEVHTERQAKVNEAMSTRSILKAVLESAALIGASGLQVFLLRWLFERKIGNPYSSSYGI